MLVMKNGKRHMTGGVKLPNQEKLRTLEEKETYKYLGILEADTIKQVEMKEKNFLKCISEEPVNYSRQNSIARTSSKGCPTCKTTLEVDQRRTQTNGPENKKTNDHASQR